MARNPRRNEPCPCGSGNKYKHCCEGRTSWRNNRLATGAGLALLVVVGLIVIGLAFSRTGGDTAARDCPPGQVWSEAHNHCH